MQRQILSPIGAWVLRLARRNEPAAPAAGRRAALAAAAPYVLVPLVAALLTVAAFRLTNPADLAAAPILEEGDDLLLILPLAKDVVERGTHWRNDRMGAPGEFQLYDFPIVDHLHLAALWALGQGTGSYLTAFNLYFLLTYPLTALTALAALRRFGFSAAAAGAGGLLYAFLYYHAARGQVHYFLSAYWVVPLSLWLVLRVCRGEPPFTELREGDLRWALRRRGALAAVAVAALTALAGAYYAFFACALLGFAGVYGSAAARSWKPLLSSAALVGVVTAAGLAAHGPAVAYQMEHGRNAVPAQRPSVQADFFALDFAHLVVPPPDHQVRPFRAFGESYYERARGPAMERRQSPLGLVAAAGVVAAGLMVLLPGRRRWPYGPVAALTVFALLLGTTGGLGSLFNHVVTPQVRAYGRLSVFIAFFGLFVSLRALDGWSAAWPRLARWALFAAVAAWGVVDQTPRPWFRSAMTAHRERVARNFTADGEFFGRVEEAVPGGAVFALPHVSYPEGPAPHRLPGGYAFALGYLHTRTVRWSYGAMRGREADQWLAEVAAAPPDRMARRLIARGFDAVCVDVSGYAEAESAALLSGLTAACGPPALRQANGHRLLFDLRPLRARLAAEVGEESLAREGAREREAVRLLFTENFYYYGRGPFAGRARASALLVNPSARERVVRVRWRHDWGEGVRGEAVPRLTIASDFGWAETVTGPAGEWSVRTLRVPPGAHKVRFHCPRACQWFDRVDPRVCVLLRDVEIEEP